MELSQLKMFQMVAEQGSIVRAADLLHCVPSNITHRIKLLEEELGVPLFIRKGKRLSISPAGALFLDYTNRILLLCSEAQRAVLPGAPPLGMLRVGAIESAATGRLPAILSKYYQAYPSVQLQFSTGTWPQLLADVLGHKLDAAVIAIDAGHPDIIRMEIYKEELMLIASHRMRELQAPKDLVGENLFLWPKGCPYRESLENWLGDHRFSTSIASIASYGTILGCINSGMGISLVPRGVFDQFKGVVKMRGYKFNDLKPVQNYFIWNRHSGLHSAREKFAEMLKAEFTDI